ncbi:MAG TPA: bifunctional DNA-binding transcriptional regulator/O6-methylguanine-DNA methyltransferase Ada [bacterium]|nr:bifunctional DNA-binding transcriptional regulator/O6-methylguanine-DNA methyltransferase Ada [bacterium]
MTAQSVERYRTDAARWEAVLARDPSADGQFVFAVTSTGIFCRPTCPSRRPRRERVGFYDTPAAARRAGFRACRRCHPEDDAYGRRHADAIARATQQIRDAERMPTLAELAQSAGMSEFHFHRMFHRLVGATPRQFRAQLMIDRAKASLRGGESVTASLYDAGFSSNGRFYETAAVRMGMTPGRLKAGGAEEVVRYAVRRCALGYVLVAATARGLCEVWLGDDADALTERLRASYPLARLAARDPRMGDLVGKVVALVREPGQAVTLPLDLRGTAFELRVWEALRRIPAGVTRTYSEIATSIGHPRAARAVGRACARNHLAVVVPCHRAVGAGRRLHGYRWGLERKRALLEREAGGRAVTKPKQP